MNKINRIKITLTEQQWKRVQNNIKNLGKKDLQSHITSEINQLNKLCNKLEDSKPCVECKQQKIIWLSEYSSEMIDNIAKKTGISNPGLIVSKFIINPLLLKD